MKISESELRDLTNELIYSIDSKKQILQRALIPTILQKIVYQDEEQKVAQFPVNYTERMFHKYSIYVFWYMVWSIKWFLFFAFRNINLIITGSLFSSIKTSRLCAKIILETIKKSDIVYINFGILEDFHFLFSSQIFCFPYLFYKLPKRNIDKAYCLSLDVEIQSIIRTHIHIDLQESYVFEIQQKLLFYDTIYDFLKNINEKSSILFYISDTDHLDTRSISCNLHKNFGIKTILIDHAINTFTQVNNQIFSDIYYCWGEYHSTNCKKNLPQYNSDNKVTIVGHPYKKFENINSSRKGRWLYILPSFQHQTAINNHRSFIRTQTFLSAINAIVKSTYQQIEFMIKPHPVDTVDYSPITGVRQTSKQLDVIMDDVELVFAEDSTTTIDVLRYEVPLIYVTNTNGEDALNIGNSEGIVLIKDTTDLRQSILTALNSEVNILRREKIFENHFGAYDSQWSRLGDALHRIISPTQ